MAKVKIFWDPKGYELDFFSRKKYLRATDGDTPYVSLSIRMLSIDTPEVHYPGNQKPSKYDDKLAQLADWIQHDKAPIESQALADYIRPKLETGNAGSLQLEQGEAATKEFMKLIGEKLVIRDKDGKPKKDKDGNTVMRRVSLSCADEHFDMYGRLLAYMAPAYKPSERETLTFEERATFNCFLVKSGWAALFPIYPSLPKHMDLVMFQKAAKDAYDEKRGVWANPLSMPGYEYRMCVKLYGVTKKLVDGKKVKTQERYGWIERYCVDMTTREIFYPKQYIKVEPYNRIFIWAKDITEAVGKMNLVPSSA